MVGVRDYAAVCETGGRRVESGVPGGVPVHQLVHDGTHAQQGNRSVRGTAVRQRGHQGPAERVVLFDRGHRGAKTQDGTEEVQTVHSHDNCHGSYVRLAGSEGGKG